MFKIILRVALVIALVMGGQALYRHFISPARSTAAFCSAFAAGDERIRSQVTGAVNQSGQSILGALGGLGAIASTTAEFAQLFQQLDAVAPLEIEPSVKTMADSFASEAQHLGDPVNAFGTALGSSMAWQEVMNYTTSHCTAPPNGW